MDKENFKTTTSKYINHGYSTNYTYKLLINKREEILRFFDVFHPLIKLIKENHMNTLQVSLDLKRKRTPTELKKKSTYHNKKWYKKNGKQYYQKTKNKRRYNALKHYWSNRNSILEKSRAYRERNKDMIRMKSLDYYYNHKDVINEKRNQNRRELTKIKKALIRPIINLARI